MKKKSHIKLFDLEACMTIEVDERDREAIEDYIMNAIVDVVEHYRGSVGGGIVLTEYKHKK